jgi:DNA-binding LacI/PurR family transcriptional regulator
MNKRACSGRGNSLLSRELIPRVTRADAAEQALREGILSGRWRGELPGLRFLAKALGVGHGNVATALSRLVRDGLVENRGARCRFRVRSDALPPPAALPQKLRHLVFLTPRDLGASPNEAFWMTVARIGEILGPEHWTMRVHAVDYGTNQRHHAQWEAVLQLERPQAVIAVRGTPALAEWGQDCGVPFFQFAGSPGAARVPCVGYAGAQMVEEAVRRAVGQGHRFITAPLLDRPPAFLKAFRKALASALHEAGGRFSAGVSTPVEQEFSPTAMQRCLRRVWRLRPPTAVITVSWFEYLAAFSFLHRQGLRIPQDVSLICLSDDPTAAWMNPEPARFVHDSARVAEVLADWVSAPPVIAEDHAPFIEVASHWAHGGSLAPPP